MKQLGLLRYTTYTDILDNDSFSKDINSLRFTHADETAFMAFMAISTLHLMSNLKATGDF